MNNPTDQPNKTDSLEAGLGIAFGSASQSAAKPHNQSVLKSISGLMKTVPQVVLKENDESEPFEPVLKPGSSNSNSASQSERYRIDGELARGGMGQILRGRDTDLGRDLAIKVLLDTHTDKPQIVQRFVEEAQIGGQLQHPGIAPVYDIGQFADQRPFFTMKLVKGKTLSVLLAEREDLEQDRAKLLGIFEHVCHTVAYAHSRNVIHRDLKPANIMVGAFGEVQVMDWGLAKVLSTGGVADETKALSRHKELSLIETIRSGGSKTGKYLDAGSQTHFGSVMGTPAYMSPEQAQGETDSLDQRTDVFGLGSILCEILTGRPAYVGDDGQQIMRKARYADLEDCWRSLKSCNADEKLVDIAKKCLSADPTQRPCHANAVAKQITAYQESVATELRKAEIRKKLTYVVSTAVVLMVAGLGLAGVLFQAQKTDAAKQVAIAEGNRAEEQEAAKEKLRQVLYASELNLACSEIQNGNTGSARETLLGLMPSAVETDLRGLEWNYLMRKCPIPKKEKLFDWSEDAPRHWGYHNRSTSNASGGGRLAAILNYREFSSDPMALVVWDKRTGKEIWRKQLARTNGALFSVNAALSSDGKLVAAVQADSSDNSSEASQMLHIWEVDSGNLVHSVDTGPTGIKRFQFSPDSKSVFLLSTNLASVEEPKSLLVAWELGNVEPRFEYEGLFDIFGFAVSPDSSKVALISDSPQSSPLRFTNEPQIIQIVDAANGQRLFQLHQDPFRSASHCRFSPDSRYLAIPASNRSTDNYEFKRKDSLTIWDVKTGQRVVSASTRSENCPLKYSPNGDVVALGSYGNGTIELFSTNDGAQLARLTGYHGGTIDFSADSRYLSVLDRDGVRSTWTIPSNNFDARDYASTGYFCISGDGKRFARINSYKAFDSGDIDMFVYDQQGEVFSHSWRFPDLARELFSRARHPSARSISELALNHDGSVLVSVDDGDVDGETRWTIRVWDVDQGRTRGKLCELDDGQVLFHLEAAPAGSLVAGIIGTPAGENPAKLTLTCWDTETQTEVSSFILPDESFPSNLEFSSDGSRVAVACGLRTIRDGVENPDPKRIEKSKVMLYRVADGKHLLDLQTPVHHGRASVAFNHDDSLLAAPNVITSEIDVWNLETGLKQISLKGATSESSLVFAPAGDRLFAHANGFQGQFNVWDINSGNRLLNEVTYNYATLSEQEIKFLPDNQRLIRWGVGGPPLIFDARPVDGKE